MLLKDLNCGFPKITDRLNHKFRDQSRKQTKNKIKEYATIILKE